MSEAAALSCPACGGQCRPEARACPFCANRLATVRCGGCSALHFAGARLCSSCGRGLRFTDTKGVGTGRCPRCSGGLAELRGNDLVGLEECDRCGGLWVDVDTLQRLTADRAQAAALPLPATRAACESEIRYLTCPRCPSLMNRVNFGRRSGVIVDVCKAHGTWFDAGELASALRFVAEGGLVRNVEREAETLRERERQVRAAEAVRRPIELSEDVSLVKIVVDIVSGLF